jgi:Flp pilus assembly protein TadD
MTDQPSLTQPEIVERGRRLQLERRSDEFFEFTSGAVEQFPDDPEIRIMYAVALVDHRPGEAPWQAGLAIKMEPDNPWRVVRAASLLFHLGEIDAARDYVRHAVQLAPEDFEFAPELANLGGMIAALDGDDQTAEHALRAALDAEPGRPDFARDLVRFLADRERLAEARAVLEQALKADPEDRALLELASSLENCRE